MENSTLRKASLYAVLTIGAGCIAYAGYCFFTQTKVSVVDNKTPGNPPGKSEAPPEDENKDQDNEDENNDEDEKDHKEDVDDDEPAHFNMQAD
jgi:hypothetical protein